MKIEKFCKFVGENSYLCECELEGVRCEVIGELEGESERLDLPADCELMKITLPLPVIPNTEMTAKYLSRELGISDEVCRELLAMRLCVERESLKTVSISDCQGGSAAFGKEAFELLANKRVSVAGEKPTVLPIVYSIPVPKKAALLMKEGMPPESYAITYAIYRLYSWTSHARRVMEKNPPWLIRLNEERMLRERVDALLAVLADYKIGL